MRLAPVTARKSVPGGGTADVPVASLAAGDLVEVVPGERMPVDGTVVEGASEADEALLSGESAPVPKTAGDPVVAGALNGTGRLLVRVARTGADTVLSRIVQAVEEAQARKAPIQRLADRVVRGFVPSIVLVAVGTILLRLHGGIPPHAALMAGISVLVIACPCALGLATPLACSSEPPRRRRGESSSAARMSWNRRPGCGASCSTRRGRSPSDAPG